ncbi:MULTISPECIES: alkaline phosphatase family protein [Chromobacterium]|uniref:alkaline phosphatase family protein n=1 Tax=Chromobacterium TaxID=535 RepID=UPI000D301D3C|nr:MULTISPECIES: nucleotide pyrophosphatase/phosphodiesterase family protein [Chromobacterium]MCP1292963.1 alkaline phosphatase family protein [Chromobacterium sp. S0633]PTU67609.1 alkaline phosphatase family protein [Chromobacterium sp. Panama]UJB32805.1 alkaline phosphatase family protein [Chromobacterium sp. Beijing]
MQRTLVLNVVGLTPQLLRHAPHLSRLAERGAQRPITAVTPALTCPAQATYLTGQLPQAHGCVANGWYSRELAEPLFWKQNNALIQGEKLWHEARRLHAGFSCAQLFWWYNMYADVDWSVTPRPIYKADGRKLPDFYCNPPELHAELRQKLGDFPLFHFWGPAADIRSSRWIADCALHLYRSRQPTLTLVYLPHLDYCLQRLGPDHTEVAAEVAAVDQLCGELIEQAERDGSRVIALSEYGVTPVSNDIAINRILRMAGWLKVREEQGEDKLDCGASAAFALADHQIAHVYVRQPELVPEVKALLLELDGVEMVLDQAGKRLLGLDHPRSGELVAVSRPDRWFSYYYWLDDAHAPDFARTVDIHRKPGYDPVELFLDPTLNWPKLSIGWTLLKRKLGMRSLLEVIPLDPSLVRGSHGRPTLNPEHGPLMISSLPDSLPPGSVPATAVRDIIMDHMFGEVETRLAYGAHGVME